MSSANCSHHRRSRGCTLCIIFSLMVNVHPACCIAAATQGSKDGFSSQSTTLGSNNNPPTTSPGSYRHIPVVKNTTVHPHKHINTHIFLQQLFDKYGKDGVMTFDGFQVLLGNLGVGSASVQAVTRHAHNPHDHRTTDYDDFEYADEQDSDTLGRLSEKGVHKNRSDHIQQTEQQSDHLQGEAISDRDRKHSAISGHSGEGTGKHRSKRLASAVQAADIDSPNRHRSKRYSHRRLDADSLTLVRSARAIAPKKAKSLPDVTEPLFDKNTPPKCLSTSTLLNIHNVDDPLTEDDFLGLCPAIIQQIDSKACTSQNSAALGHVYPSDVHEHSHDDGHDHEDHGDLDAHSVATNNTTQHLWDPTAWGYAFLSVVVISGVGLLSVALIPIMHKAIYNYLIQFLVSLAIGTLTADASLHLIPHSMVDSSHGDGHSTGDSHAHHKAGVWRGLVMLGGIYVFFLSERLMELYNTKQRKPAVDKTRDVSTSPNLYETVVENENDGNLKVPKPNDVVSEEMVMVTHTAKDVQRECHTEDIAHMSHSHVQGHTHTHGLFRHTSTTPTSPVASVAWMVIIGDSFHNFLDGLAVGAAFATGIGDGVSTSIAVLCHELPHEIGDFAVLLRAGMSVRRAIAYNCISSVLCLIGMIIGMCVGNIENVTQWIFAAAAGMFIYIALVDMLPELTAFTPCHERKPLIHFALQNAGMLSGIGIMVLIALYEDINLF